MKKFKNYTLKEYLSHLAKKEPVPGGGSAAALTAALGVALITMVAQYSRGKSKTKSDENRIKKIISQSEKIRTELLELVDEDAQAYLKVVAARKKTKKEKSKALTGARRVPLEVCRLCFCALDLTPFLVKKGNQNLVSDIEVAIELLLAAFESALINFRINQ